MAKPTLTLDLGGTNLRLALVEKDRITDRVVVSSRTGIVQPIKEFLAQTKARPERCVVGVAGVVAPDRKSAQMSNLSFNIDAENLRKEIRTDVLIINDFEAMSWGVLSVKKEDVVVLVQGMPDSVGTKAIIGAGTGLGEGLLFFDGAWRVIPSEGGGTLLAGVSKDERDFIDYLIKMRLTNGAPFPSYENILSGRGLYSAYDFFRGKIREDKDLSRQVEAAEDRPAMVSHLALEGKSKAAEKALDLFVTIYAEACMNLALLAKATGGVYIVGNIAQKNQVKFTDGRFVQAFLAQRMPSHPLLSLLKGIPLYLCTSPDIALIGAATAGKMIKK